MIRSSRVCESIVRGCPRTLTGFGGGWGVIIALGVSGACGSASATAQLPVVEPVATASAQALGWVDPVFVAPRSQAQAESSARFVALRSPMADKVMMDLVEDFYDAVVEEDIDRLTELTLPDAVIVSRMRGGVGSMLEQWRTRFRSLSYEALRAQRLFRASDVETYVYDDWDGAPIGRPSRPAEMAPGDRLVRVPMAVVRVGGERVFGDELGFVLRPKDGRYRIRAIIEEFQPQ